MSHSEKASVSVVMPIRNENRYIRRTLGAVLDQSYQDGKVEVIVADGLSTDGTRNVIKELQAKHHELHIVDNPAGIVSTGLNAAIRRSTGNTIIRIDGHTVIARDYVQRCIDCLDRTGADNVGGAMNVVAETRFGEAVALATSSRFGIGGSRFHYLNREEWVDTVYMGAWRRDVFYRIGLFDEEMVRDQDDEFNYRLRSVGGRILLSPDIKSEYTVRSDARSLWRQYFQYGYWKVRVLQKHLRQMCPHHFAPPVFVAAVSASLVASPFSALGRVVLALIVGAYTSASVAASVRLVRRHGWRHCFLLLAVFAILHVGYGSGFLVGLLRFAHRWNDKEGRVPRLDETAQYAPASEG